MRTQSLSAGKARLVIRRRLELWQILEKQKLIASNLGGGHVMRSGVIPAGDKLRAMLLVAAGDELGTVKLVIDAKASSSSGAASEGQAKASLSKAAAKQPARVSKPAQQKPEPSQTAEQHPKPSPKPSAGRGRPATDIMKA